MIRPRRIPLAAATTLLLASACWPAAPALALRANMSRDVARLEQMGRYEEALFFRRSTRDMVMAVHVAWSGAPYDPAGDAFVFQTRTDRRYWNMVNGQKRPISDLLAKARLTAEQLDRLDERVRVYVEDHLSPDFDEMGNFYFRRQAMTFESIGMFLDASFRRRLCGYYDLRVCAAWYAMTAEELERQGKPASAAYRAKADFYRRQALVEFRRCNGDRLIWQAAGSPPRQPGDPNKAVALLRSALRSNQADARLAAVCALGELGQASAVAGLLDDADGEVARAAREALASAPWLLPGGPAAGRGKSGLRARYYTDPAQAQPRAEMVLPEARVNLLGNERFPRKLAPFWRGPQLFGPRAAGQFLVRLEGRLAIPADGSYRFYVKSDGDNRAIVRFGGQTVISPKNDRLLLYSVQNDPGGGVWTRVDFSAPVPLKAGLADLAIEFRGADVRSKVYGQASMRLYWSSDAFVMEPVPATAVFCPAD